MLERPCRDDCFCPKISKVADGRLVTCSADKYIKFWNWETGELLHSTQAARGIPAAAVMLDDRTAAIGGGDASIRIYDWHDGKDLMGQYGFIAMDYTIVDMCRVFLDDAEAARWTRQPVLYRTIPRSVGEDDAKTAIESAKVLLKDALGYKESS
mmetsp:Transcript_70619/g.229418  ORF Transcript_70619/g.229418 Transcript_70619/m.229418 type:complete len:154 (-) Transcript_70619:498-959(-)